jgi:hypothetical protein
VTPEEKDLALAMMRERRELAERAGLRATARSWEDAYAVLLAKDPDTIIWAQVRKPYDG